MSPKAPIRIPQDNYVLILPPWCGHLVAALARNHPGHYAHPDAAACCRVTTAFVPMKFHRP
jgi:hypothetical protein